MTQNIDEAADKYLLYEHNSPLNTTTHKADVSTEMQYHKDIINTFKAGAIWQEEQDNICYEEIFEEGAAWKAQEASEWLADNADYYGDDTKALQIDFDRAMAIENKKED